MTRFASLASNLFSVGQPALTAPVILRWDRLTGGVVLASQTTQGEPLLALGSITPVVSDDGNQVVFQYGGGVAAEVERGSRGVIYRRDIAAGTLTQVSTIPVADGAGYLQLNELPSISSDGATIVYAIVRRVPGSYWRIGGTVCVLDAASNTLRATYPGLEPHLSRGSPFLMFAAPFPRHSVRQLPGPRPPAQRRASRHGHRRRELGQRVVLPLRALLPAGDHRGRLPLRLLPVPRLDRSCGLRRHRHDLRLCW